MVWGLSGNALPAALTLTTDKPEFSRSVINRARLAGYETYWLSNQSRYAQWDFSVSTLAKQANHIDFNDAHFSGLEDDSILLEKLTRILAEPASRGKRLIVLHFFGSHMKFANRYPNEFDVFDDNDALLDSYDNSVLYTDHLQHAIIQLVGSHGGKYLFFADHGLTSPHDKQAPLKHDVRAEPSFESLKVPLLSYPKNQLGVDLGQTLSLFHFECLFVRWAGITARDMDGHQCESKLNSTTITYFDSSLQLRQQNLDTNAE